MSTGHLDQVKIIISCDQAGVFEVEIKVSGVTASATKVLYNDLVRGTETSKGGEVAADLEPVVFPPFSVGCPI